jgi:hypothetical protein
VLGFQKGAQGLSAQARAIEWNPLATLRCSGGMVLRVALLFGGKKSPPPTTSSTRGHTMAVVEASGPSQDRPTRPVLMLMLMLSIPAVLRVRAPNRSLRLLTVRLVAGSTNDLVFPEDPLHDSVQIGCPGPWK